ncbi:MAG: NAD(P)-dependent oxidoreductase [Carbonactinosporaceae bacterium]
MDAVGIVGVGAMGSAMAGHLVDAGFRVTGYDVAPDRLAELTRRGGTAGGSCREVLAHADVVITSLPSVAAFDQVVAEVAEAAPAGLAVAETSTLPLEVKERGRELLAARDVTLLDCPLSGTGQQARTKDVVVYASGDHAAVNRFGPVFDGFARRWCDVGAFGAGSRLKFVANLLVAVHNASTAEALLLARKAGLDLDLVLDVVADGAGTSRMFEIRGPQMARRAYEDGGIQTRTFQKDIEIIAEFARSHDCPVPLFAAASQLYTAALGQGRDRQDTACVHEVLAGMAGVADVADDASEES